MILENELTPARLAAARAKKERLLAIAAKAVPDLGIDLRRRLIPKVDPVPPPEPETAQVPISVEIATTSLGRDWMVVASIESRKARFPADYLKKVISIVSKHFNVSIDDLRGVCRENRLITPRHIAIYLANKSGHLSNSAICRHFNRDHTTGVHAQRKIKYGLLYRAEIRQAVDEIEQKLNEYLAKWRAGL